MTSLGVAFLVLPVLAIEPPPMLPQESSWHQWCMDQGRPESVCRTDAEQTMHSMRDAMRKLSDIDTSMLPVFEQDLLEQEKHLLACKLACFEENFTKTCTQTCEP